jgi:superfamily II DNA/RNA helicase
VVNYDFPTQLQTYVHRVGRTGRQGAPGHAYSFFTRQLGKLAAPLQSLLEATGQWIDPNLRFLATENAALEQNGNSSGSSGSGSGSSDGSDDDGDGDGGGDGKEPAGGVASGGLQDSNYEWKAQSSSDSEALEVWSSDSEEEDVEVSNAHTSEGTLPQECARFGAVGSHGSSGGASSPSASMPRRNNTRRRRRGGGREYTAEETRCWLAGKAGKQEVRSRVER